MLALPLNPAVTLLLLFGGLALIYVELNRPGHIVPGALGLLALLLAMASIAAGTHPALAMGALLLAFALFALDTRIPQPLVATAVGVCLLYATWQVTLRSGTALRIAGNFASILAAIASHLLARIAWRARANKARRMAAEHLD